MTFAITIPIPTVPFPIICKSFGRFQSNLRAWKKSQSCEALIILMIFIEFRHHNTSSFWGYGHSAHTAILLDTRAFTWARPASSTRSGRRVLRWSPHRMTSAWRRMTQDGPGSPVLLPSHATTCCRALGKSQHPSYPRFSACRLGMLSALKGVTWLKDWSYLEGRKEPEQAGYLSPQVWKRHLISVERAKGRWAKSHL